MKISNSLALFAVAAPVVLSGCAMTSTYGTGQSPEVALLGEMTGGLGIIGKKKKEPIDYQPRAPLVLPPSGETQSLPEPVQTASVDPNWPSDPNDRVLMHADGDDDPKNDISREDYERTKSLAGILSPGRAHSNNIARSDLDKDRADFYKIVHERQDYDKFAQALAESKGYARKERKYLTDPPVAYREPAGSAPTGEVETGETKRGFWKKLFPGR